MQIWDHVQILGHALLTSVMVCWLFVMAVQILASRELFTLNDSRSAWLLGGVEYSLSSNSARIGEFDWARVDPTNLY
jgi:hypothetical protein